MQIIHFLIISKMTLIFFLGTCYYEIKVYITVCKRSLLPEVKIFFNNPYPLVTIGSHGKQQHIECTMLCLVQLRRGQYVRRGTSTLACTPGISGQIYSHSWSFLWEWIWGPSGWFRGPLGGLRILGGPALCGPEFLGVPLGTPDGVTGAPWITTKTEPIQPVFPIQPVDWTFKQNRTQTKQSPLETS